MKPFLRSVATVFGWGVLVFGWAFLVIGCTTTATAVPNDTPRTNVSEIRLSDGTRCAVIDRSKAAAISCDWKTSP